MVVLFFGYGSIPLGSTQMNLCIDCYMRESAVGIRSVPMYHVCRNSDHVTGIQNLYGFPLFLIVTFSGSGDQNLATRMRVPTVSGFRLEYHVGHYYIEFFTVGYQPPKVGRAVEISTFNDISFGKNGRGCGRLDCFILFICFT